MRRISRTQLVKHTFGFIYTQPLQRIIKPQSWFSRLLALANRESLFKGNFWRSTTPMSRLFGKFITFPSPVMFLTTKYLMEWYGNSYRQIWREASVNGLDCLCEGTNVVISKPEKEEGDDEAKIKSKIIHRISKLGLWRLFRRKTQLKSYRAFGDWIF